MDATRWWAKSGAGAHLVACHGLDAGAVTEAALARNAVLCRKFMRLSGDQCASRVVATQSCFMATHDNGKIATTFAQKVPALAVAMDVTRLSLPQTAAYDHATSGWQRVLRLRRQDPAFFDRVLGPEALPILQSVFGHHGMLPSSQAPAEDPRFAGHDAGDDVALREHLEAFAEVFRARGAALPWTRPVSAPLAYLTMGLASFVDWVASNPERFPHERSLAEIDLYYARALVQAHVALDGILWSGAVPRRTPVLGRGRLFPERPVLGAERLIEGLTLPPGPSLVVLEAAKGSGTLEAALDVAAQWIARGDAGGLYVAQPTRSSANEAYPRVAAALPGIFQGSEAPLVLTHADAVRQRIIAEVLWTPSGEQEEDEARGESLKMYASARQALLAQAAVGTIDQLLGAAMRIRYHAVRLLGLASKAVVIEGLHTYDAYTNVLIDRTIEWLAALEVPIVATAQALPAVRRREVLEAYARGAGWTLDAPQGRADAQAYPLVTLAASAGATCVPQVGSEPQPCPAACVSEVASLASDDPIDEVLVEMAQAALSADVVWVRNTASEARGAYLRARSLGIPARLLYGPLSKIARRSVVRAVQYRSVGRQGVVLIATQVEQLGELAFDRVWTDLCPAERLLERLALLRESPGTEAPRAVVVTPSAASLHDLQFGASGKIYDPVALWLVATDLQNVHRFSVRGLLERSLDPATRASRLAAAPNAAALQRAQRQIESDLADLQMRAARVCLPPPSAPLVPLPEYWSDDPGCVHALTRAGERVRLLPIAWDASTGTGGSVEGGEPWDLQAWESNPQLVARVVSGESVALALPRKQHRWSLKQAPPPWIVRLQSILRDAGLGNVVPVRMRAVEDGFVEISAPTRGRGALRYSSDLGLYEEVG